MKRIKLAVGLLAVASWFSAAPARADLPPPDACDEAGEACSNAGDNYDEDGICRERTCTKGPPGQQMSYDCLLCELGESPATGGSTSNPPAPKKDDDDEGCSVSAAGTEHGLAGILLLAGLGMLIRGRRR
jgi:MYXO-CTERM domain-containing protein